MASRFVLLLVLSIVVLCTAYRGPLTRMRRYSSFNGITMMSETETIKPGNPLVKKIDESKKIAYMTIALSGEQTQKAFNTACDMFNEEVKTQNLKVQGFRPGAKVPPFILYQMFGEEQVKKFCATLLSEEIQDECDKTGLKFVGRGRITDFSEMKFTGGKPHTVDIECDLWPEMTYSGATGYKGLKVTASKTEIDIEKYEKVKRSIMERYKVQGPTDASYAATMGDVVVGSMTGYEEKDDGSKGPVLPSVASGTSVDIALETGKYMPGLVEGLVGAKAGDVRTIRVQFPVRPTGAGAALSGKKAIFDVAVSEIKTQVLPDWNEALATRIRPELTLKDLETEVTDAVQGERAAQTENLRNDAIAKALHDVTIVSKIPESLVEETTMNKFQTMLSEFKEQGTTEEQLREMATPENYEKYRGISKANVERTVILSMAFADIAAKENIAVTSEEIKSQLDLFAAQAKQKGDKMEDTKRVSEEIENTLLRKKVFDFLASHADITWVEAQVPPAV